MSDAYSTMDPAAVAATRDPRQALPSDALSARPPAPQGDALGQGYDQVMQQIMRNQAAIGQLGQKEASAVEPIRQQQLQMLRQQQRTMGQPPQAQQASPVPQARNEPGADEQWLMAASVLGAIAGGLTRNHVTNALGAMTGALEGYQQGSKSRFDQAMTQWEAENKKIQQTNKDANDRYRQILESNKLSLEMKAMEIQLTAAQYKDQAAMLMAQNKDLEGIGKMMDARMTHAEKAQEFTIRIEEGRRALEERLAAQKEMLRMRMGLDRPESESSKIVDMIGTYRMAPYQGVAARSPVAASIMEQVGTKYPDYNAAEYQGRSRAIAAFKTGRQGDIVRSLNTSIDHLDTIQELGDAMKNHDTQAVNRIASFIGQQTGSAAPTNLQEAARIVGAEIQKALGAMTGHEREEAAAAFANIKSPEQITGAVQTAQRLLAGQMRSLQRQYETSTGLKNFTTSGILDPRTIEVLGSLKHGAATSGPAPAAGGTNTQSRDLGGGWNVQIGP